MEQTTVTSHVKDVLPSNGISVRPSGLKQTGSGNRPWASTDDHHKGAEHASPSQDVNRLQSWLPCPRVWGRRMQSATQTASLRYDAIVSRRLKISSNFFIGGRSICVGSDDLEWPWKARREGSNFQADLLNNTRTVWPRTIKFWARMTALLVRPCTEIPVSILSVVSVIIASS